MKPSRRPKAVLFDAGNTLVFLDHQALAEALANLGIEASPAALAMGEREAVRVYERRLSQRASHDWHRHMLTIISAGGVDAARGEAILDDLRTYHDDFNFWRLVPAGLPEALQRLRSAGLRVGVVSNSEGKLDDLFRRVGISGSLEVVVDSAIEGVSKPDPEIFERALGRLKTAPGDALYVGDLPSVDITGARAVGMSAALIDPDDRYRDLEGVWRASTTVQLIAEVLALPGQAL